MNHEQISGLESGAGLDPVCGMIVSEKTAAGHRLDCSRSPVASLQWPEKAVLRRLTPGR
ncbi:MAG: hypothetical protein ABSG91_21335 [Syntrophobacteraceae bacterium]